MVPYILGSRKPKERHSPLFSSLITLITYLLSFTLALSCPWLALAYLSPHLTALVCWLINIRDSVFSYPFFVLCTNHLLSLSLLSDKIWFWDFPPWVLSLTFYLLFTFLSSAPLWTLSDFTSASLLHLPVFCLFVWPLFLCGRTGESDWRGECAVLPTTFLHSTVPERREQARSAYPRLYS